MDKVDLIEKCQMSIDRSGKDAQVVLFVHGKWSERGYKKVLGVKGEQVLEDDDGVLCSFPAAELMEALLAAFTLHGGEEQGK
jgi:hypothetical protein